MKLDGLNRELRLWSSLCMHRREHKTPELRERTNASERMARQFRFVVVLSCPWFSFFCVFGRYDDNILALNCDSDTRILPRFKDVAEPRRREYLASRLQRTCIERTTTGVVTRADLVEDRGFTDLPLLARTVRASRAEPFLVSRLHYITHRETYIIPSLCKYL